MPTIKNVPEFGPPAKRGKPWYYESSPYSVFAASLFLQSVVVTRQMQKRRFTTKDLFLSRWSNPLRDAVNHLSYRVQLSC